MFIKILSIVFVTTNLFLGIVFAEVGKGMTLLDSYNKIDITEIKDNLSHREFINNNFDITESEISSFMLAAMNRWGPNRLNYKIRKDKNNAGNVMACINYANPARGLNWLFENYDKFNPIGQYHFTESLKLIDYVEAYESLIAFMGDKTPVYKERKASRNRRYGDIRICDNAYGVFNHMLFSQEVRKEKIPGKAELKKPRTVMISSPIEKRDKNIRIFKKWWEKNKAEFLENKKSIPGLSEKIEELNRKIQKKMLEGGQ